MSTEYEGSGRPEGSSGDGDGDGAGRASPRPAAPPPAVPPAVPGPPPAYAPGSVGPTPPASPPPPSPPGVPPALPSSYPAAALPAGESSSAAASADTAVQAQPGPWGAPPATPPDQERKRRGSGLLASLVAVTLIAGLIGGGVGYLVADRSSDDESTVSDDDDSNEDLARSPDSVAGIADSALPSVVTIETGSTSSGTEGTEESSSTGTGFVYDEDGHILTNNHVVADATEGGEITATFNDGESYNAEIVGTASGYDVAVLRLTNLDGRDLEPLELGDSDDVAVGDAVIAIGAPYGLDFTVTEGIISAKDRPVASSDSTSTSYSYMNALQTDASINPGNSGGPLINADGEVIGINSAIETGSDSYGSSSGSIGLGFAIPINQADRVAQDLIETGEPVYAIIGASVDISETTGGAQIVESTDDGSDPITEGGPADEAGLEPGDVITEFDGREIDSGPTLISEVWTHEPGETVEVVYKRDGEEYTTDITLGERVGDTS